jgi:hypothetical protein
MHAERIRLACCFGGSLVLNGIVLFPAMLVLLAAGPVDTGAEDAAHRSSLDEATATEELELGIDESTTSTLTWIGYEEYLEHVARRAEFEQAQMKATSGVLASGRPSQPVQVTPPAAVQTPETHEADSPTEAPPADTSPQQTGLIETLDPGPALTAPAAGSSVAGRDDPSPTTTPIGATPEALDETPGDTPSTTPAPQEPLLTTLPQPSTAPPTAPPSASSEPAPNAPNGSTGVEDAPLRLDGTDMDSDATSTQTVTMEQMNLGHPLARTGLKLYPRKPEFTSLRVVSSGGKRGIMARLVFNDHSKARTTAGGVVRFWPAEAYIGRVVNFGKDAGTVRWFNQVNLMGPLEQTIHSSLFAWTAVGAQVETMAPDAPVIINLDLQIAVK